MLSHSITKLCNSFYIIFDCACGKFRVENINKYRNEAITVYFSALDKTFVTIQLNFNKSPRKLVFNSVWELRCLTKSPFPFAVIRVNIHQLRNFHQFFFIEDHFVNGNRAPFKTKLIFHSLTEILMGDLRTYFFQIHYSRNNWVNSFWFKLLFVWI